MLLERYLGRKRLIFQVLVDLFKLSSSSLGSLTLLDVCSKFHDWSMWE